MSVMALEGYVKNGQIRLLDSTALPEKAQVYVVVAEAPPRAAYRSRSALASLLCLSRRLRSATQNDVSTKINDRRLIDGYGLKVIDAHHCHQRVFLQ